MLQFRPMVNHPLGKPLRVIFVVLAVVILLCALGLLTGLADSRLSQILVAISQRQPKPSWTGYFRSTGAVLLLVGMLLLLMEPLIRSFNWLIGQIKQGFDRMDQWFKKKTISFLDDSKSRPAERSLRFNRWDALLILFFVLIAFVYQIAVMSSGYPTVILGGDAANIASFAAARAYPDLFTADAILGNLENIGLYVTIHLPLAIWLEKLVGNFGLAYSLLLFPHVFLQYFSYYLLGRVLFHNRYWSFLFSLAVSSPLILDGGEMWGVSGDALPRITFQVLIPFVLILLLSTWRDKTGRWFWIMIIAGLMAFIHPVSTPVWAFALWLGFWVMFPEDWDVRHKMREMFKLGVVLALALLPYVSIYLTHHQSGSGMNYDLVHYILTEYFPSNILNIPAAVGTMLHSTGQFGLLWYGLAGLAVTVVLFRNERPRLKQLLTWMIGIIVISILIPWIETEIERLLRLIPLQTELMRGMRYLIPFLFIFWFYPFAELTRQSTRNGFTRAILVLGTLLTLGWLLVNPPYPFRNVEPVFACWQNGQLICPKNMEHADALAYIRESTPEGSKFTVFLTSRWSGIEVRYLALRPMVYAFKDRGQLLYTNIESLQQWNEYQQRENEIFSPRKSPTLDEKRTRMVKFSGDAGADYILTDFPFPPDMQDQLHITIVYQNSTYSILKINSNSP